MPRRRRSPSRSRTRRHQRYDEMRGRRRTRTPPLRRLHGETGGGESHQRLRDEWFEKKEVVVEEGRARETPTRRLRSEIGEVSGSLRRITRGEFLAAEVFARSPPPPPPFLSQVTNPGGNDGLLFGGGQAGAASSLSLPQPAAPVTTVRTSSSAAADDLKLKPPPEAVSTASYKKRKSGPESSPKETTTTSSKTPKTTTRALGHPEVHRQQNKSPLPSAPKPPPKRAARFPAIPLPPPPSNDEVLATQYRIEEMRKKYADLIAKSQDVIGVGHREGVLKGRANLAVAEEELLRRRRDAERAKAREALQEVEREARRTRLCAVERIHPEHLRELDITRDIEYVVSPECHRGEDGVLRLRLTPPRYSPVADMLGLFVKAQDGGELELDEE